MAEAVLRAPLGKDHQEVALMTSDKHTITPPRTTHPITPLSAAWWRLRLASVRQRPRAHPVEHNNARWSSLSSNSKNLLRAIVFERDGWRCVQCGSDQQLTIDHKRPQSRGGSSRPANLQTMCATCNGRKGARA
jgi:5-methylcytosine-specific restriction endonuclease McrA